MNYRNLPFENCLRTMERVKQHNCITQYGVFKELNLLQYVYITKKIYLPDFVEHFEISKKCLLGNADIYNNNMHVVMNITCLQKVQLLRRFESRSIKDIVQYR